MDEIKKARKLNGYSRIPPLTRKVAERILKDLGLLSS